jgi:transketolase
MSVVAPCDPLETEAATWACAEHTGPVYLRLGKAGEPDLTSNAVEPFQFGKIRMLRPGSGVCILSYGPITKMAADLAARIEQAEGRKVGLVSVHTLKPLDVEGISKVLLNFDTVIVVEEHTPYGGLATRIKEIAWDSGARCRLCTFTLKDQFIHCYGSQRDLWSAHGLSLESAYHCFKDGRHT